MGSFSICSDDTDKDDAVVYRGMVSTDSYVAHGLIAVESSYLLLRRRNGRYLGGLWDIPGGTVAKIEIAEAGHDEAQWLSLGDALKLPLVWHVRRTLEAEQSR